MAKRFISVLLALVMSLTMVSALAESDTRNLALGDYDDVMDMTGYFDHSAAFGDENLLHEWIKENLKINIIGTHKTGESSNNKLAQMVASNDMLDVVYIQNTNVRPIVQEMVDAGMLAAADDYFDIMPNYLKWREGAINDFWANEEDGKHYMLPGQVLPPEYFDVLGVGDPEVIGIREDILEATGKEIPKTVDELYDLLVAAKDAFADQGGIYENFIPFGMLQSQTYGTTDAKMVNHMFGMPIGDVYVDDENGQIVESFMLDSWADAQRFLAKLYREGLLDPDVLSANSNDLQEKGKTGAYGLLFASISQFGDNIRPAMRRLGIEADYVAMDLPGINGIEGTNWLYKNSLGNTIGMVSAKAADVERIFKYVDWQNTPIGNMISWNGAPDKEQSWFYLNDDGEAVFNQPIKDMIKKGEMTTDYIAPWTYWVAGLGVVKFSDINTSIIDSPGVSKLTQGARDIGMKQYCNDPKLDRYQRATHGEAYEANWTDIQTIVDEYRANLIMRTANDEEFDEVLAEMYDVLEAAGIQEVMEENYQIYQSVNE